MERLLHLPQRLKSLHERRIVQDQIDYPDNLVASPAADLLTSRADDRRRTRLLAHVADGRTSVLPVPLS
jgi:hypothetical protein